MGAYIYSNIVASNAWPLAPQCSSHSAMATMAALASKHGLLVHGHHTFHKAALRQSGKFRAGPLNLICRPRVPKCIFRPWGPSKQVRDVLDASGVCCIAFAYERGKLIVKMY